MLPTLARHPPTIHATHASAPPMKARHTRKHAIHASMNSKPFYRLKKITET